MRLLNTDTLKLEQFTTAIPEYAILSHTWEKDEILYDDARLGKDHLMSTGKSGLRKIVDSCKKAAKDGYGYIWIDTCCIDKSSSAELSEAINSMFEWYRESKVCYTYLADLHQTEEEAATSGVTSSFLYCRWFSRGWTLQELIAPFDVRFYDADWNYVGDRISLAPQIKEITGITDDALCRDPQLRKDIRMILKTATISTRMNWASFRTTTRPEDRAYSLMGIFDVNMPLLYGEGSKSFRRLQEEIVKVSGDQTILAWELNADLGPTLRPLPFFAPDPSAFKQGLRLHLDEAPDTAMSLTGAGLEMDVLLGRFTMTNPDIDDDTAHRGLHFAALNCFAGGDPLAFAVILLREIPLRPNTFVRVMAGSRTIFEIRDDCRSHRVDTNEGYDVGGVRMVIPDMDVTRIEFEPTTATRKRILIVEQNQQKKGNLPLFRLRCGNGMDGYQPTHELPSIFSQQQLANNAAVDWGLLHLTNTDPHGFFIVWVIENDEAFCSAHSWEEVTGRMNTKDKDEKTHRVDSFNNARDIAGDLWDTYKAHRTSGTHPVSKVSHGTRLVYASLGRTIFMNRICFQFTLESEPNTILAARRLSRDSGTSGRKRSTSGSRSPTRVGKSSMPENAEPGPVPAWIFYNMPDLHELVKDDATRLETAMESSGLDLKGLPEGPVVTQVAG